MYRTKRLKTFATSNFTHCSNVLKSFDSWTTKSLTSPINSNISFIPTVRKNVLSHKTLYAYNRNQELS